MSSIRDDDHVNAQFVALHKVGAMFRATPHLLIPRMVGDAMIAEAEEERAEKKDAKPAPKPVAKPERAPRQQRRPRGAQIFDLAQLDTADQAATDRKDGAAAVSLILQAKRDDGYRRLPSLARLDRCLDGLRDQFANMSVAIDRIAMELSMAAAVRPEHFRVTPILLVGEPGLGKTFFARRLAEALGVAMDIVSAGGAQGGFALAGTSAHWSNATPGGVARLLAAAEHACPVLVIDEVDKIQGSSQYPVLPALLDLLEPGSSRAYKDECLEMRFDASKMIIILTANDLDLVPAPLKSRLEVVQIPRPDVTQRLQIVENEMGTMRKITRRKIELAPGWAQILAEREDLDLRKTTRIVKDAFAKAMLKNELVATPEIPAAAAKKTMGFGS